MGKNTGKVKEILGILLGRICGKHVWKSLWFYLSVYDSRSAFHRILPKGAQLEEGGGKGEFRRFPSRNKTQDDAILLWF